jgi:hypothetical protein
MASEDSAMVDALGDAVAGAVMLVMGGAHTGTFGFSGFPGAKKIGIINRSPN